MTGTELKDLRIQAGYSLTDLAKLLGLTGDRTLRRWENGTRPIPAFMVELIRKVMNDEA